MRELRYEQQIKQDDINLYEFVLILRKRWKFIVGGTLLATITATVISLFCWMNPFPGLTAG